MDKRIWRVTIDGVTEVFDDLEVVLNYIRGTFKSGPAVMTVEDGVE